MIRFVIILGMTYSNGAVLGISTSVVSTLALTGASSASYTLVGAFLLFVGIFGAVAWLSKEKEQIS